MTTPNPPQLPKVLEEVIIKLQKDFMEKAAEINTKGTIHSSYKNEKETHMVDFYGYRENGGFARISITVIISDRLENLSLGD